MRKICLILLVLFFAFPLFAVNVGFGTNVTLSGEADFLATSENFFSLSAGAEVNMKVKINNSFTCNVPFYFETVSSSLNTYGPRFLQPRNRLSAGFSAKESFGNFFSLELGLGLGFENYPRLHASSVFYYLKVVFEFFTKNNFNIALPLRVMYNDNYYSLQVGFTMNFGLFIEGKKK